MRAMQTGGMARADATRARLPDGPPLLQVVVDTEEEFDWHKPFDRGSTGTTAIAAQHLAQSIFDRYGIRPSYVVDYPVATSPAAVAVLRGFMEQGRCLIGTHLHPWVNPPHDEEVTSFNSFVGNLAPELERTKLEILTEAITDGFGVRPTMYKAGGYGVGPETATTLKALGYEIDLSVVPFTDYTHVGGPNFQAAPDRPYWIGAPGGLLEIPLARAFTGVLHKAGSTIFPLVEFGPGRKARLGGVLSRLGLLERATLTPEGSDLVVIRRLLRAMLAQGHRVFTMTYHSPSLVPGHTPYVRTAADLDRFLAVVAGVLETFFDEMGGQATTAPEIRAMALEQLG